MRRVAVAAALAVVLAACGVPNDGEPRGVRSADVPDELLAPSTTLSPETVATQPELFPTTLPISTEPIEVYLVKADVHRVVRVERTGPPPSTNVLATAQAAADVLLQSPLSLERQNGLTTTLTTTTIRCLRVDDDGTLDIEVAQFPRDLGDQPLAMAQIVWTLTGLSGVGRIRVFRDGQPSPVPLWVGGEAAPGKPVDRSDYIGATTSLGSPEPTSTTTTATTVPATTTTVVVDPTSTAPAEQTPPPETAPPEG